MQWRSSWAPNSSVWFLSCILFFVSLVKGITSAHQCSKPNVHSTFQFPILHFHVVTSSITNLCQKLKFSSLEYFFIKEKGIGQSTFLSSSHIQNVNNDRKPSNQPSIPTWFYKVIKVCEDWFSLSAWLQTQLPGKMYLNVFILLFIQSFNWGWKKTLSMGVPSHTLGVL